MQVSIGAISVFYMFIYIVAELTSISSIYSQLTANVGDKKYGIGITVAVPASIVTDKFQRVIVGVLVVIITLALTTKSENHVSRAEFDLASNFHGQGFTAAISLVIAILSAEMFNQSTWQRVWAAESVSSMRKGFFIGSTMAFFLMMFFGIIGMFAYANDPAAYDSFEKFSFLAFFDLLAPLGQAWQVLVLILVTALTASSVDSLQNGLTSIFYHDLVKIGWNPTLVTRFLMVVVNIPAIFLASDGYSVIELFLVADIVCATLALPVFLGLQTRDIGLLPAPTELGAFLGCVSGIVTVLVTGVLVDAEGGLFEYFWLRNNEICALCGNETLISFIVTPIVSGIATYLFSYVDVAVRGDRAREPLIPLPYDQKSEAVKEDPSLQVYEQGDNANKEKEEASASQEEEFDA